MNFKDFYKELIFDIDKPILRRFTAKQGDTKSRGFYVPVMQNGAIVDVMDESMTFYAQKPDGTRVFQNAVKEGGLFRVDLKNQVFAVAGVVKCELTLYGTDGEKITNKTFVIEVEPSLSDDSIVSEDERGVIDDALEFVEEYVPRLELIDIDSLENYDNELKQNKVKISTVEKELNDYKRTIAGINVNQEAKQEASGYGIVSLPKNAVNGQVSGVVRGLTATNLVKNGDFRDGLKNWTSVNYARISNQQSVYDKNSVQCFATNKTCYVYQEIPSMTDDKYYFIICYCYVERYASGRAGIRIFDIGGYENCTELSSASSEKINTWQAIGAKTKGRPGGTRIAVGHVIVSDMDLYIDGVAIVEITEEEYSNMSEEELLQKYPYISGTKSTIGSAKIKSVGKNLFDKNKVLRDKGLTAKGRLVDIEGLHVSDFIPVEYGFKYVCQKSRANASNFGICFYDKNKQYITGGNYTTTNPYGQFYWTEDKFYLESMPPGTKYVRFTIITTGGGSGINDLNLVQFEKGDTATEYEPYIEDRAYVTAVKDGKIVDLMSHEGIHDEIDLDKGVLIKRLGVDEEGLIYQLAEPEIIPIQVSGSVVSHPSGTVYIDPATTVAGVYMGGIPVTHTDLPIDELERITVIDYATGLETELDVSQAVISDDKLLFTHPDLSDGDIVFFEYEYDVETTQGETTIQYYDSRYTIKDSVTGKFYKWEITVADGVPSIELVEV